MKFTSSLLACLLLLAGCDALGGGSATPAASAPAPAPSAADASLVTGVLRGVVRLAEGATLPSFSVEQMEKKVLEHAKRGPWPDACTPPKQLDRQPVRATEAGTLSGLLVAASKFSQHSPRPQKVHEIAIRDCRLQPTTVAAMVGDVIRVTSEVSYPFMPSFGNEVQIRTLTPGQNYDVKLDKPGVTPVLCGFTAPCGRTDVVVMMHPLSAVTGDDGSFQIDDFPADEKVKLSAWHPLFNEVNIDVELGRGEDKKVELVITPIETAVAPAQASSESAEKPAAGEPTAQGKQAPPGEPAAQGKQAPDAKPAAADPKAVVAPE